MATVLWTQKQDVGPSARGGHAIAYDAARQRVVLFGGRAAGATPQGDTWEWDGENWTQVADTGPDPRAGHALAFDANRQRAVLFGGEAGESALRGDTWEWDGEDWTQVADTGPDARLGHALAFDTTRQRALLFGGEAGSGLQADTWEWDGEDWTQVADTGPEARRGHALAFDTTRQRAVLFGGAEASGLRADTWEWDGATWTQKADTGPGPSLAPAMTFGVSATLLFGGVTSPPALVAVETLSPAAAAVQVLSRLSWEWDGELWTLRQDMGPAPRWGHALAFDSARVRAVLFGGFSALPADPDVADSVLADTWETPLVETPVDGPGPGPGPSPTLMGFEQAHRVNFVTLESGTDGFATANAFGSAFLGPAHNQLQAGLAASVANGSTSWLLEMPGLTDLTGRDNSSFNVGIMNGVPRLPAGNPTTYDGTSDLDWWYVAGAGDIDTDGSAIHQLPAMFTAGTFNAGPGAVRLIMNLVSVPSSVSMSGTRIRAVSGPLSTPLKSTNSFPPGHLPEENLPDSLTSFGSMSSGQLVGDISAASLAAMPIPAALVGTGLITACSENYTSSNSMLDVLVRGCHSPFIGTLIKPTQPDQAAVEGDTYRFTTDATTKRVTGCTRNGAPASLADGLAAAAYSSHFRFTTSRVIRKRRFG
jgi:Galactose oxidase, central domain